MLVKINKLEAAGRQINCAIELLFGDGDPIAVHTLAAAGFRIIRDLGARQSTDAYRTFMSIVRPGKEGAAFKALNHLANFVKHADNDADETCEFDDEVNLFILSMVVVQYQCLVPQLSIEMRLLLTLIQVRHPDLIDLESPIARMTEPLILPEFRRVSRSEQLRTFAMALSGLRQRERRAS